MTIDNSRRTFPSEFKRQIVQLHKTGKPNSEIFKEYNISSSMIGKWAKKYQSIDYQENKDTKLI
ncbi:transposase-like protein [Sporosarcina luteola]|nr:transposase-like protein [Sporosarcina luteola]